MGNQSCRCRSPWTVSSLGRKVNWIKDPGIITRLTDTSDTILLGRKMAPGFMKYWEEVIKKPESPEYSFARKMVDIPKIVFSKTLKSIEGQNVRVENGDLTRAIEQLKKAPGKILCTAEQRSSPRCSRTA